MEENPTLVGHLQSTLSKVFPEEGLCFIRNENEATAILSLQHSSVVIIARETNLAIVEKVYSTSKTMYPDNIHKILVVSWSEKVRAFCTQNNISFFNNIQMFHEKESKEMQDFLEKCRHLFTLTEEPEPL